MSRPYRRPTDGWEDPAPSGMPQLALPRMTKAVRRLMIANGVVYAIAFAIFLASEETWVTIQQTLGLRPSAWIGAFPLVPLWQPITYGFLHSIGDPWHLINNLLVLYFFGTMLEEIVGTRRFVVAYFSAQLLGALFFLLPGVLQKSPIPAIGASGAVYGVMIAVATLRPLQRVILLFIPLTLRTLALIVIGVTVFSAALQWKQGGGGGTAHLVHLGGIAYGYLAVKLRWLYFDPFDALARARVRRDSERKESDQARVDALLDKIHREGMASLTSGEREFLKRVSSRR